ncbi:hypothetical protein Q9F39_002193 [Vibrio fluvialis]|nr:hypothetical protein [Vibrio fluvialis]
MTDRVTSAHIWRAIAAQANTVAASLELGKGNCSDEKAAAISKLELKRLRILEEQLENMVKKDPLKRVSND